MLWICNPSAANWYATSARQTLEDFLSFFGEQRNIQGHQNLQAKRSFQHT